MLMWWLRRPFRPCLAACAAYTCPRQGHRSLRCWMGIAHRGSMNSKWAPTIEPLKSGRWVDSIKASAMPPHSATTNFKIKVCHGTNVHLLLYLERFYFEVGLIMFSATDNMSNCFCCWDMMLHTWALFLIVVLYITEVCNIRHIKCCNEITHPSVPSLFFLS